MCLESLIVPAKATASPHRGRVGLERVLGGAALGQAVPAADDLGGIVEAQLVALVGVGLEGAGDRGLVDGQDEDLVVGEQVLSDGFAEPEPVQFLAEEVFVVHRREDGAGLTRPWPWRVVVDPGRGGHVEPLVAADVCRVVDPHEGGLVFRRRGSCRGAVSLVADDEVERGQVALAAGPGRRRRWTGRSRRRRSSSPVSPTAWVQRDSEDGDVRRRGEGEVDGGMSSLVALERAVALRSEQTARTRGDFGLGGPLTQGLRAG